jgi:hypothetical protein
LLVALFDATAAEVGWVLAVYNASGFVASLVLPTYADRKGNYLWPMLACGVLTLALAVLLYFTTSLPIAVIGLLVLGGPAGVGSSLLFAYLKYSGARPSDVVNTRAIVSVAWVAGPPLATHHRDIRQPCSPAGNCGCRRTQHRHHGRDDRRPILSWCQAGRGDQASRDGGRRPTDAEGRHRRDRRRLHRFASRE